MPSIIVVAHNDAGGETSFQLHERVSSLHLDDSHLSAQLLERVAWDAEHAERTGAAESDRR
jgi:hypothetical protein